VLLHVAQYELVPVLQHVPLQMLLVQVELELQAAPLGYCTMQDVPTSLNPGLQM
jgi:hypothetical protein